MIEDIKLLALMKALILRWGLNNRTGCNIRANLSIRAWSNSVPKLLLHFLQIIKFDFNFPPIHLGIICSTDLFFTSSFCLQKMQNLGLLIFPQDTKN